MNDDCDDDDRYDDEPDEHLMNEIAELRNALQQILRLEDMKRCCATDREAALTILREWDPAIAAARAALGAVPVAAPSTVQASCPKCGNTYNSVAPHSPDWYCGLCASYFTATVSSNAQEK